jgi:hypothetical protein
MVSYSSAWEFYVRPQQRSNDDVYRQLWSVCLSNLDNNEVWLHKMLYSTGLLKYECFTYFISKDCSFWNSIIKNNLFFSPDEGQVHCVDTASDGSNFYTTVLNPGSVDETNYHRFTCYVNYFEKIFYLIVRTYNPLLIQNMAKTLT